MSRRVRRLLSYTSPVSSKETGNHGQLCFHLLTPLCHAGRHNPLTSENSAFRGVTGRWNPVAWGWSWFCACPVRAEGAIRLRLRTWLTWCLRLCGRGPGAASWGAMVIRCQVRVGNLPGHFCPTPIPAFKRSRTRLPSTLGLTRVLFLGPLCSRSPSRGQIRSLNLVFW